MINSKGKVSKVASSNTPRLEAHAGFFRLLMKVIFDPYVLKAVLSVRKHLFDLKGCFGLTKYNNIGTFDPKCPSGNC